MEFLSKYLKRNGYILWLIILIFLFPNVLLAFLKLVNGHFFAFLRAGYSFIVSFCLLIFLPIVVSISLKKYFRVMILLSILIPVVCYIILIYEKTPTRWMIYTILNATKPERIEFTNGLWQWKLLIVFVPVFLWILNNRIKQPHLKSSPKVKRGFLLLICALLLVSYSFKVAQRKTLKVSFKVVFRTTFKDTPVYTIIRLNKALRSNNKKYRESDIPLKPIPKNSPELHEFHLLIIGESSRYSNWQLNGYARETSPLLIHQKDLVSYSNVTSPGHITNISLPVMLSSAGLENLYDSTHHSIVSVLNSSGYKTSWISNQRYSNSSLAEIARQSNYFKEVDNSDNHRFDEILLKELQSILSTNDTKQFVVMHLKGSHYPYHNRYPEVFERFIPSLKRNMHIRGSRNNKEKLINTYDNSILYTDYVVDSALTLVKRNKKYATIIFISDHGEVLFNKSKNGFGRGFDSFSKELFHIPFFLWTSKEYKTANREISEKIIENAHKAYTATDLSPTIFDLVGIELNNFNKKVSFFKESTENVPRFVQYNSNVVDFDKIVGE